jgi:hypothetical protein
MADIDDGPSLRLEARDDVEQALGFTGRERCGRLIEDDQAGIDCERLGDLDELAFPL